MVLVLPDAVSLTVWLGAISMFDQTLQCTCRQAEMEPLFRRIRIATLQQKQLVDYVVQVDVVDSLTLPADLFGALFCI